MHIHVYVFLQVRQKQHNFYAELTLLPLTGTLRYRWPPAVTPPANSHAQWKIRVKSRLLLRTAVVVHIAHARGLVLRVADAVPAGHAVTPAVTLVVAYGD